MSGTVVTIANPKGGVGKTVTTVNVAACAASRGISTLVVDCDPQGHAGLALGVAAGDAGGSAALAGSAELGGVAQPSPGRDHLQVVAADLRLEVAARAPSDDLWLARALAEARETWELILIDTPPGLGPLTRASLLAADRCLVPVAGGALGAVTARRFFEQLPALLGPLAVELDLRAVFTRFRRSQNASRDARAALHDIGVPYIDGNVREAAIVEKSIIERRPLVELRPSGGPARDYAKLTDELLALGRRRNG
jgi:chromosome partitioning protein